MRLRFTFRDWLAAGLIAATVVGLGMMRQVPGVTGVYHDDGVYLATAKALAEGDGYRLINLPESPLQTKYPFLYPAMLAILWRLWPSFPDNIAVLQAFSLVCTALALSLGYLYLVRFNHAGRLDAAGAALLCATSSTVLFFGTQLLSEPMFALLAVCGLWLADSAACEDPPSPRRGWLAGLVLGASFLVRLAAAPFVAAPALLLLRRDRRHLWMTVGLATAASLWVFWVVGARVSGPPATLEYETAQPYLSWWLSDGAPVRTVLLNVVLLCHATLAVSLASVSAPALTWGVIVAGAIVWGCTAYEGLKGRLPAVALLAYAALVLFWPWPPSRFVVPVAIFTTLFVLRTLRTGLRSIQLQTANRIVGVLLLAAVAVNVVALMRDVAITRRTRYPQVQTSDTTSWEQYRRVFGWIRTHTHPDDVLASGLDSMVWAYTDRRALRPFELFPAVMFYSTPGEPIGTVQALTDTLAHQSVKYFVRLPMPGAALDPYLTSLIDRALKERPGCLEPRYVDAADRRFAVYQVQVARCGISES